VEFWSFLTWGASEASNKNLAVSLFHMEAYIHICDAVTRRWEVSVMG
jgi:hypothetical protein